MLTLFFLGGQSPDFPEGSAGKVAPWTNCKTSLPITVDFHIPLAVVPRFEFDAGGDLSHCLFEASFYAEKSGTVTFRMPVQKMFHGRLRPPCEMTEIYHADFVPENPNPFDQLPSLTVASFHQEGQATMRVDIRDSSGDVDQVKKSLAPRLPLVIGFTLVPYTEIGWDFRFEARSAFALSSVESLPGPLLSPGSYGKTLIYRYSLTRFRPEWHTFDFENLTWEGAVRREPLQNKDIDLASEQAPHMHTEGDRTFLGSCELVKVQ